MSFAYAAALSADGMGSVIEQENGQRGQVENMGTKKWWIGERVGTSPGDTGVLCLLEYSLCV